MEEVFAQITKNVFEKKLTGSREYPNEKVQK
jgi:hypothetical protein